MNFKNLSIMYLLIFKILILSRNSDIEYNLIPSMLQQHLYERFLPVVCIFSVSITGKRTFLFYSHVKEGLRMCVVLLMLLSL